MTAFCRGYLCFGLRFISSCPNKAGMIVSEPVHLSVFAGAVLWTVASAEGEHLKALSRAGSDSEIRGGRFLSSSRFFPHTRIELNPFFKEKLEVPSVSVWQVSGDSHVFLSWSFTVSKLQVFIFFCSA